jgi:hypothetical protein
VHELRVSPLSRLYIVLPIPVTALFEAWVSGRWRAGIAGSNPAGGLDVSCECCVLSGRSLRRADHSSRGVLLRVLCLECDREASIMRRHWPTSGCCAMENILLYLSISIGHPWCSREASISRHKQLNCCPEERESERGGRSCSQLALQHIYKTEFDFFSAAAGSRRCCCGTCPLPTD